MNTEALSKILKISQIQKNKELLKIQYGGMPKLFTLYRQNLNQSWVLIRGQVLYQNLTFQAKNIYTNLKHIRCKKGFRHLRLLLYRRAIQKNQKHLKNPQNQPGRNYSNIKRTSSKPGVQKNSSHLDVKKHLLCKDECETKL